MLLKDFRSHDLKPYEPVLRLIPVNGALAGSVLVIMGITARILYV